MKEFEGKFKRKFEKEINSLCWQDCLACHRYKKGDCKLLQDFLEDVNQIYETFNKKEKEK